MSNRHPSFIEGLSGMLVILFAALKILGIVAWSWVWVLSPFWLYLVIMLVINLAGGKEK